MKADTVSQSNPERAMVTLVDAIESLDG